MAKALEGIRILESGRFFAAPVVGMLLGDMGAEVIRYEEPEFGDPLRRAYAPLIDGVGPNFLWSARNKKSITLNLRMPQGKEIFKELVKISDIVTENFTPGTMDRWGLGYEELKKVNPSIIMLSISMYGHTGPYSTRPGIDHIVQAASGLMSVTGDPDGPATFYGIPLCDYTGGFINTYAVLSALYYKQKTGLGQWIDNSLFESSAFLMEHKILHYTRLGEVAKRKGSRGLVLLSRSFPCKDGDVYIVGSGAKRRELCKAIGREDILEKPQFQGELTVPLSPEAVKELDGLVEEWTKTKTRHEIVEIMVALDVMAAPVNDVADVVNDPQYKARGALATVDHPTLGKLTFQGPVPKMSLTPPSVELPPPLLGQHNDYVFGELLRMSQEQIEQLKIDGVI